MKTPTWLIVAIAIVATTAPAIAGMAQSVGEDTRRGDGVSALPSPAGESARVSNPSLAPQGGFDASASSEGFPLLGQAREDAALRALLEVGEPMHNPERAGAIALADRASHYQAAVMGIEEVDPVPLRGYQLPSRALVELSDQHGVTLSHEERRQINALDRVEEPVRQALTGVVDAFLALETAAGQAYASYDISQMDDWGSWDGMIHPLVEGGAHERHESGEAVLATGVDLAPILASRGQFLDAIGELATALDRSPDTTASSCSPIRGQPAFSIDLAGCDNLYHEDVALLIDAGGNDTYHNNAGGNHLRGLDTPTCGWPMPMYICDDYVDDLPTTLSAALLDLGEGDDVYGDPEDPRSGVNGGAFLGGMGLLIDQSGNDTYNATSVGTNGGGALGGVGLLIDQSGDDTYNATSVGTNGGGALGGVGLLIDQRGNDTYNATSVGTNGGGGTSDGGDYGGVGLLVDQSGNDTYNATSEGLYGANGYSSSYGRGGLIDQRGFDVYTDGHLATYGYEGGTCTDCTLIQKGTGGAQVDASDPDGESLNVIPSDPPH